MRPNLQFPVDLVTFIEETHNEKLHFLCSDSFYYTNHFVQYRRKVGFPVFCKIGFHSSLLNSNPSANGDGIFLSSNPRYGIGLPGLSYFRLHSTKIVSSYPQQPMLGYLQHKSRTNMERQMNNNQNLVTTLLLLVCQYWEKPYCKFWMPTIQLFCNSIRSSAGLDAIIADIYGVIQKVRHSLNGIFGAPLLACNTLSFFFSNYLPCHSRKSDNVWHELQWD